jgi:hypothetical protein
MGSESQTTLQVKTQVRNSRERVFRAWTEAAAPLPMVFSFATTPFLEEREKQTGCLDQLAKIFD